MAQKKGLVQKRPFPGNIWPLGADCDRSRLGAGLLPAVAALGLQVQENRV
jgi:hypothetical protein